MYVCMYVHIYVCVRTNCLNVCVCTPAVCGGVDVHVCMNVLCCDECMLWGFHVRASIFLNDLVSVRIAFIHIRVHTSLHPLVHTNST